MKDIVFSMKNLVFINELIFMKNFVSEEKNLFC